MNDGVVEILVENESTDNINGNINDPNLNHPVLVTVHRSNYSQCWNSLINAKKQYRIECLIIFSIIILLFGSYGFLIYESYKSYTISTKLITIISIYLTQLIVAIISIILYHRTDNLSSILSTICLSFSNSHQLYRIKAFAILGLAVTGLMIQLFLTVLWTQCESISQFCSNNTILHNTTILSLVLTGISIQYVYVLSLILAYSLKCKVLLDSKLFNKNQIDFNVPRNFYFDFHENNIVLNEPMRSQVQGRIPPSSVEYFMNIYNDRKQLISILENRYNLLLAQYKSLKEERRRSRSTVKR